MKFHQVLFFFILTACFSVSCGNNAADVAGNDEARTYDSTTAVVKENTEKLSEQTSRVEESIEKIDKEFNDTIQ